MWSGAIRTRSFEVDITRNFFIEPFYNDKNNQDLRNPNKLSPRMYEISVFLYVMTSRGFDMRMSMSGPSVGLQTIITSTTSL